MAGGLLRPVKQENVAAAVRRGGRVVDGSGLENRQSASSRGFESHPLRRDYSHGARIRVAALKGSVLGDSNAVRPAGRVTRRAAEAALSAANQ